MRNLVIILIFIFPLAIAGFAQDTVPEPVPDSSCHIEKKINSVFDTYWVTNCIKCGWKTSDTSLVGEGLEPCDSLHPFIMPVDGKFWRGCTYYHSGWDIGCPAGTPVLAGLNGMVRYARYCSGYGNLVIVRHYSGMEVYYAHLSKIKVKVDEWVDTGDTVGLVGATGRARGNHLHMEFRLCDRALDIADYYVQNDTVVNLYKIFNTSRIQSNPQTAEYHTVVRGDTLYAIARRYGTTVANLCTLNNISSKSVLRIGQKLLIR
jgi:murein DD-endopeptidase MepM/ murein hydrolase activator NlpD